MIVSLKAVLPPISTITPWPSHKRSDQSLLIIKHHLKLGLLTVLTCTSAFLQEYDQKLKRDQNNKSAFQLIPRVGI